MPLDSSNEPRARASAWRDGNAIKLWLSIGNMRTVADLSPEDALEIGEKLVALATAPGPRVGTAADLGYVEAA